MRNKLKETVCWTCGDRGILDALAICANCRDSAEHRYCSREWPKNFEDDVDWICSDCLLLNAEQSIPCDPIPINNIPGRQSSKVRPEADLTKFVKSMVKMPPLLEDKPTSFSGLDLDIFQMPVQEETPMNEDGNCLKEGVKVGNIVPSQDRTNNTSNTSEAYDDRPAQPFSEPTWKGGFSICSDDFCSEMELAAHLSTRASFKVFETAQQFPPVLHLNIYPRLQIWPKSFYRSEPTDGQIGIYFLPETERDESLFNSLLEHMVDGELALMAVVDNLELLVFTSLQLPKECWRFMGNYYLWGVLKKCSAHHQPYQPQLITHCINHVHATDIEKV